MMSDISEDKPPKPILIGSPRRSITGLDYNILKGDHTPPTPIPTATIHSQQSVHDVHFNQMDEFEIGEAIGYGSSAIVYKAIYKPTQKRMALKMIDLDMFERNQIDELRRETALMALSKHPNVLRVYGSFVNGSKLYIVTPYLAGGSCLDIMKTRFSEGFEESIIATILKQALEGLVYLHKNGHIHRDVKAGNLLMDEDGAVLLGDFGVSSSLMETGEKGMRKTFVGTPCWMAPEVMEQAAYDYKADIWSFGITALELATGHAPFAKHPPLKVLMMTLQNDPPTLDRESTTHKFSRTFKDMIDSCLSKDPTKRPTAEKLLQHAFFKQAKKRDFLIRSVINNLPPLEQRPRKKIVRKSVTITKTDEWDFDDDEDADNEEEDGGEEEEEEEEDDYGRRRRVFNGEELETPKKHEQKATPKRHISFGDAVIRNNSNNTDSDSNPPVRKSRFVIEETSRFDHPDIHSTIRSSSPIDEDTENEVMKGRFHVNQPSRQTTMNEDDLSPPILYKVASQDRTLDRKSRFEVQTHSPIPLSRESSMSSSGLPRAPATTTIAIGGGERKYPDTLSSTTTSSIENTNSLSIPESSRKIGRFELTGGSADVAARIAETTNYDMIRSPQHQQLEELIKSNETQRLLLQDLCYSFNMKRRESEDKEKSRYTSPITDDLMATLEHLEKLVQISLRENQQLQKENDNLRKELKDLKK
ncbi:kinase-like protein, partial [Backusella circina FSU 941]